MRFGILWEHLVLSAPRIAGFVESEDRVSRFGDVLHGCRVDELEIERVRSVVMFEEPDLQARLVRFTVLLTLAAAIATFGLLADSVAAVIGAMIVAPLMLPIMGLAFGISVGDLRAIRGSFLVGLGGAVLAVAVGYVLSFVMPSTFDPTNVTQIISRTAPRLIDLLAALATGLAGAFAIGRKDVSDTLPGVAIAISLVPPLANAGILLGTGETRLAMGSLLLFVTNYLAILLTGSLVFTLMGFPALTRSGATTVIKGVSIAVVAALMVLIIVPLGGVSLGVYRSSIAETRATVAAESWLAGTDYRVVSASVDKEQVNVVVAGSGQLPSEKALKAKLAGNLFGMRVSLLAVPSQRFEFSTQ
jgi:uncharacterized hydrophobic protein (TIGR00271 family)